MIRKNSLFVDTSGWISYVGGAEPFHHETLAIYREAIEQKRDLVTTNYVIAELVAFLQNHTLIPRQHMYDFVDRIKGTSSITIVHIDEATDAEAWIMVKRYKDKDWSLVDAASFIIMRRAGLSEALTTDHHFVQAGFIRLPAL